jgi:hypothetical protein
MFEKAKQLLGNLTAIVTGCGGKGYAHISDDGAAPTQSNPTPEQILALHQRRPGTFDEIFPVCRGLMNELHQSGALASAEEWGRAQWYLIQ